MPIISPGCHRNMSSINESIKTQIASFVSSLTGKDPSLVSDLLEIPKNTSHGDFSLPLPKLKVQGNPVAVASELASKFQASELLTSASSIGPFLNFTVCRPTVISSIVSQVLQEGVKYGSNDFGKGKTVLVEYSSPNIAKPFHAGHFRTTVIGNFIKLLYRVNGYHTIGINYLGDWGKQFGLLAVGFEKFGTEEKLLADPIDHLFDVYVAISSAAEADPTIHEQAKVYFREMEAGNETYLSLWKRFRDLSLIKYQELYKRLNVEFDIYSGESIYEAKMKDSIELMKQKNLLEESKGALVVDLTPFNMGKPLIVKSDGATLYLTRDIAAAQDRAETYQPYKSIYVIASPQDLHMQQLCKILELMNFPWAPTIQHISYGTVLGMSTRKGNVVFLEDILDKATETMHEVMRSNPSKYAQIENPKETSEILAISAMIIQDMSARRVRDYTFDMKRMTSFEGDTGPYLQFAHSRLCSIARRAHVVVDGTQDLSHLTEPAAFELANLIARYPSVVIDSMRSHEPCIVVTYLMSLSHAVSHALEILWVLNQPDHIAKARLALYTAARFTLGNGLALLGLKPLERM